ncbi:MAG TPA: hypothetical protein VEZ49_06340 [Gemmatimonadales bacterium]|nr:hypothetical protein [Gemmatimonadales bacterium]
MSSGYMQATMIAMIILMVPAFLICVGVAVLAYRKRKPPSSPRA